MVHCPVVADALEAVEAAMRPGTKWTDMQTVAYRAILEHLKSHDVVRGEVEDMLAADVGAVFMPHGLGHFLGVDTHDVGGYNHAPARSTRPGYRSLRTTRSLIPGNVITVEPGCYMIDALLDAALRPEDPRSKFLNTDLINSSYRGIGGVRLEDNVAVTADGIENMVYVPRSIEQVEAMCAGKISSRDGFARRYQR
jgi:Xaa-Pro dipeptidase